MEVGEEHPGGFAVGDEEVIVFEGDGGRTEEGPAKTAERAGGQRNAQAAGVGGIGQGVRRGDPRGFGQAVGDAGEGRGGWGFGEPPGAGGGGGGGGAGGGQRAPHR